MSRLVVHTQREKKVYNISLAELKKGEWLKDIPDSDLVEIQWKSGFLTISDAKIKRQEPGVKPMEDEENGRTNKANEKQ
jgi:hypothetical protein